MSHMIAVGMATSSNLVIPLSRIDRSGAAIGPAGFFKAVRLQAFAQKTGGAAGQFVIAPIVVADGDTAPSAATLSTPGSSPTATTWLDSTANPLVTIGAQNVFTQGYRPDVYGEIVATHVMVTCLAAGGLQLVVD
jgi:hypothetical protein